MSECPSPPSFHVYLTQMGIKGGGPGREDSLSRKWGACKESEVGERGEERTNGREREEMAS